MVEHPEPHLSEVTLFQEIYEHISHSKALLHLNLSECNLNGRILIGIPEAFTENVYSKLKRLDLSGNRLSHMKRKNNLAKKSAEMTSDA
jgi:hypothetical protein